MTSLIKLYDNTKLYDFFLVWGIMVIVTSAVICTPLLHIIITWIIFQENWCFLIFNSFKLLNGVILI